MPGTRLPYPPEFREQMVALVRSGRTPESLSREFEPTAQTIHNWVRQADLDEGRRTEGLPSERKMPRPLRSERRRLRAVIATTSFGVLRRPLESALYTSIAFGLRCKQAGVRPSMGSVGDAYDNALCESFFATLECELLERKRFRNQAEAKMAVFDFIEAWYNPHRRHSALGHLSPLNYERRHDSAA